MAELRQMYIDSILKNSNQESENERAFLETLSLEELEELNTELSIEKSN